MTAESIEDPVESSTLSQRMVTLQGCFTTIAGISAISGGIITLSGWALEIPRLTDWLGTGISMFPNAAVCSLLLGTALISLKHLQKSRWIGFGARLMALVTCLIAGLTLFEHASGSNVGIDEFLFEGNWGQRASMSPNRMGVPASVSFMLLSICILLAVGTPRERRLASAMALIATAIASLPLLGYWFGVIQLFGVAKYTGIAWQTGAIIVCVSLGLIAAVSECGFMALIMRRDTGGMMARRLLLPIIVIPLVLGWGLIKGVDYGLFDNTYGTASRTLLEIIMFLGFLWWTANCITRHAATARAAAEAHRISEQRFISFMQALPGLAWIKDAKGRYVYVNDSMMTALQKDTSELYGRTDREILPEETAVQCIESDRLAWKEERGLQFVETWPNSKGGLHPSLVTKFPITDSDGGSPCIGGIAIDITDRMRAEDELKKAHQKKDEFLATLAHELRNPLSPIRCSVEICRSQGDPEKRAWALGVIDRQVGQLARLLDDLLDISRISHGKVTLRREKVELSRIVASAAETTQPLSKNAGQSLEIDLPDEAVYLDADPVRLEQIFSNLLNNAAKYAGKGARVVLKATKKNGSVAVSIRDNGIGIPAERLADIFEMFSQVDTPATGQHGGLGIGLSLVRGLVQLHGGRIDARSDGIGKGCEFIVTLPLHPDEHKEAGQRSPNGHGVASEPAEAETAGQSLRLLVTDDLPDSADSLSTCIRAWKHEVRTAYDGAGALAVAEEFRPDIILLDIGMPELSGDEVCRLIREREWGKTVFIVAITGWGQESDRRLTAEAGFDHHLIKPVNIEELSTLVSSVASKKTANRARAAALS